MFSVKDVPLDHPNGLCTTVPEIPMSLDEIGAELRNWVDGEANAKLDKWFKKYGEEFAGIEKTPKNNSEKTTTSTSTKNKKVKEIDYLQSLANKGVKVDLDSFKNIDKKLFNENAKQLDYLINKYPKVQEYIKNNPFIFKAESMNISTNACCGTNFEKTQMSIALNIKNYNDYNDLIDSAKKCIESRWSCKGLEEKLSVKTLTHEFGHAIHNVLIDNYNKTHQEEKNEYVKKAMSANTISASRKKLRQYDEKLVKSFNKEIIKIAKGIDKNLDTKESISKYGKTSPYEFFAECFAEYECHGGTTYAKAMEIFLERNFK